MDTIDTLINRGVDKVYPSKESLEKVLKSGKKLRIYQGFDPTSPQLHIGHMIGLRKLRQWQDAGHEVIFLIGDFTGTIGDPTGKDKTRIPLTREQVLNNAKYYKEQAGKILRFSGENPVQIKYNSEWLAKIGVAQLAKLMSYMTYQQVIERDMFQNRMKNNMDISINEFLYPLLQAYDSVAMDVDVEVGGSDQMFNMMTGRDLMHKMKKKNKFVMTTPLLTDSEGNKIGKTEGNVISLTDNPNDLYGKIMALGDDVIVKGLEYLTEIPMEDIKVIADKISRPYGRDPDTKSSGKNGDNPMKYKKLLAFEIVKLLNSEKNAQSAQAFFEQAHQSKDAKIEVPALHLKLSNPTPIIEIISQQLKMSKSEVKRLIKQKAVDVNNNTIDDVMFLVKNGDLIKVGKNNFFRI